MTHPAVPADDSGQSSATGDLQPRFDVLPGTGQQPATVRAAGDVDLTSAGRLEAALAEAAATSGEIIADLTAVTYCDSAAIRALFAIARENHLTLIVPENGPVTTMLRITRLDKATTVIAPR